MVTKTTKFVGTSVVLFVALLAGSYFYLVWSLRHMKVEFPLAAFLQRTLPKAEVIGAAVGARGNCLAVVDSSSLGRREDEAEMSFVATMPGLYKERFGTVPSKISDLEKLPEFDRPDALNGHAFLHDCSIYADPGGAFAVSCGRSRPPRAEVLVFMQKAKPVQAFSMLGKSEILYVPAPKC